MIVSVCINTADSDEHRGWPVWAPVLTPLVEVWRWLVIVVLTLSLPGCLCQCNHVHSLTVQQWAQAAGSDPEPWSGSTASCQDWDLTLQWVAKDN